MGEGVTDSEQVREMNKPKWEMTPAEQRREIARIKRVKAAKEQDSGFIPIPFKQIVVEWEQQKETIEAQQQEIERLRGVLHWYWNNAPKPWHEKARAALHPDQPGTGTE